jgi:hypothetical protein
LNLMNVEIVKNVLRMWVSKKQLDQMAYKEIKLNLRKTKMEKKRVMRQNNLNVIEEEPSMECSRMDHYSSFIKSPDAKFGTAEKLR